MNLQFSLIPKVKPDTAAWSPVLDVYDNKGAFVVSLEAPGLRKEDFTISWHDGELQIAGERKEGKCAKEGSYFHRERSFGRFSRTVSLPADVQSAKIAAAYQDGVLTVTLPKAEQAKPKQIEVSVN